MAMTKPASTQVTFLPAGTGAVATTVQTKLRETVSVKDFGAVGDGVTDDTTAIVNAWKYVTAFDPIQLDERASKTLYFPPGIYLLTQNFWLNTATITPGYTGRFYTIEGAGMGQSIVVFKPTAANAWMYDQTQASSPTFAGLEFRSIFFKFDNSANGSSSVNGFKVNAASGSATQAFQFDAFRFIGVSSTVFMYLGGTVNASENKFINCRFYTLSTLIDIQNSEAVNHTLVATDVENVYGHIFVTKQAGNINWLGGSVIFADAAPSECSIINLGGNVPATGTYTSSSHLFMGLRTELRAQYSRVLYVTDNNVPVPVTFLACNFAKVDYNQDFAKVTVSNNSYIAFRDCTLPQSSTGSKFRFTNNPTPTTQYTGNGLIKSYVLFDRCRSAGDQTVNEPYADFSQVTDSDIYQGQVVEYVGCENIPNAPSYGLRYRAARTDNPVNGNLTPFRGYEFPYGNGTVAAGTANYFNLTIPHGAFVEKVQVSRAVFAAHSTVDYEIELVDGVEFNTPGTGVIYGTMPVQKYNLAINWSVAVNKRFTGTANQRTLWIRLKTGVTATSGVGSENGVVFASVF